MSEIIFLVEEAPEGGYTAKALGESIITEAETVEDLKKVIKDAVICHFEPENTPQMVTLHFVKDETFSIP